MFFLSDFQRGTRKGAGHLLEKMYKSLLWPNSEARVERYVSLLDEIGPVQNAAPRKKSNRGPKPGKTTILTSPKNVNALKERQLKRKEAQDKKEANQKKKQSVIGLFTRS